VLIDVQGHPLFSPKFLGKSCQWSLYNEGKYPLYNHPVFHGALRFNYSVSQPVSGDPSVCSTFLFMFFNHAFLYNLVNKTNLVHNCFLVRGGADKSLARPGR